MSRSKAVPHVASKPLPGNGRSVNISSQETSKSKLKKIEGSEGAHTTEKKKVLRQKPGENDLRTSRERISKDTIRKSEENTTKKGIEVISRQNNLTNLKPSPVSRVTRDNKTVVKPTVETGVGSKSRSKDHSQSSNPTRLSQGTSGSKLKGNDAGKNSPSTTGLRKGISSETFNPEKKSSRQVKPAVSKHPIQDKNVRKREEESGHSGLDPSHVIKKEGERLNRERTKTRTLHPDESQLMTTLQKAAQQLPREIETESQADPDNDDYEDDFEDYESDFEEAPEIDNDSEEETEEDSTKLSSDSKDDEDKENYDYGDSSSSLSDLQITRDVQLSHSGKAEEKKMDSGHYDLADEHRLSGKLVGLLTDCKNTPDKERQVNYEKRTPSSDASSKSSSYEVKFINFAQAKRRQQERKASSKLRQRGEVLLNMIRLDSVSLHLFEMAPIPYEVYMRSYGRSNTLQASSQTNEDGIPEEVQTDDIISKNKWTQHPPAFLQPDNSLTYPLICAVSSDPCDEEDLLLWRQISKIDTLSLEKFISNTGQLMLSILEESSSGVQGLLKKNKVDLGFSQGFIILGTESVPFLENRRILRICFLPHQPNSLLTIHQGKQEVNHSADLPSQIVNRCLLCLWSLLQPSLPLNILVTSADVTACTIHPVRPNLIFAGLVDGLLNVWDLKEQSPFQSEVLFQNVEWKLRSPSYATVDYVGIKHSSAVVGVQIVDNVADSSNKTMELSPTQICSLDESGLCLIWTVLRRSTGMANIEDTGIAPWGCIRLLQNESFSIASYISPNMEDSLGLNLQFSDLALDNHDAAHMLAATNTGHVAHCLCSGSRAHPALYLPDWDCLSPATCICPCPFGLPYFLVGCADGTVRLHSRLCARPLLSVAGSAGVLGSGPAVACIQWSNSRPCVFFVLDAESRLHVWDLGSSDMYPMLSVPFRGKIITSMQLSPSRLASKACPYLVLGTACGKLKVHLVSADMASTSLEDTAAELDKFKRYVAIL